MRYVVLLILGALVLAGCGTPADTDGPGGGGGGAVTYDAAHDICAGGIEQTAELYSVPAERDAVVNIVVEQVSGGSPDDAALAKRGCEDALDGKPKQAPTD